MVSQVVGPSPSMKTILQFCRRLEDLTIKSMAQHIYHNIMFAIILLKPPSKLRSCWCRFILISSRKYKLTMLRLMQCFVLSVNNYCLDICTFYIMLLKIRIQLIAFIYIYNICFAWTILQEGSPNLMLLFIYIFWIQLY